eukprot:scaffold119350_cov22-Tisochrysis_lutea.AAC.5
MSTCCHSGATNIRGGAHTWKKGFCQIGFLLARPLCVLPFICVEGTHIKSASRQAHRAQCYDALCCDALCCYDAQCYYAPVPSSMALATAGPCFAPPCSIINILSPCKEKKGGVQALALIFT